ncbi:MAG: hypothetical protein KDC54_08010 [Lewinella sp.]|nr:hypothetical protein [Lewinella sp.]
MRKHLIFLGFLFAAFLLTPQMSQAQEYRNAVGARLGYPLAASYKQFISESSAIEVYAGFRSWSTYSWFSLSGAYQIHNDLSSVTDGLTWYYGAGASVFFWSFKNTFLDDNSTSTTFAIQGYLGLEYTFDDTPLSISVDWVPSFFINGYGNGFGGGYGALAARYVLNR